VAREERRRSSVDVSEMVLDHGSVQPKSITKLYLSNLDERVSNEDIHVLFFFLLLLLAIFYFLFIIIVVFVEIFLFLFILLLLLQCIIIIIIIFVVVVVVAAISLLFLDKLTLSRITSLNNSL
jgi:uncharacterized membrane protein